MLVRTQNKREFEARRHASESLSPGRGGSREKDQLLGAGRRAAVGPTIAKPAGVRRPRVRGRRGPVRASVSERGFLGRDMTGGGFGV